MKTTSSEEQIFFEDHPQIIEEDQEMPYQRSSSENQNQYLSQFLNSQGSENLEINKSPKSEQLKSTQFEIVDERKSFSVQNKQNSPNFKKREKSCFHNFQKHLVITLRNMIKLKKCNKVGEIQTIGFEMWHVFANSSLYSKKYLHVLFGVYGNNEQNQFSKHFLNDLGFMEIFAKYSEDKIKEAQDYLRKQIIKQLESVNMKQYLTYRKLKRADEFQTYISEFVEQLKEGSVRKRLPKDRKMVMITSQKQNQASREI